MTGLGELFEILATVTEKLWFVPDVGGMIHGIRSNGRKSRVKVVIS